jgi:hypothetical protein
VNSRTREAPSSEKKYRQSGHLLQTIRHHAASLRLHRPQRQTPQNQTKAGPGPCPALHLRGTRTPVCALQSFAPVARRPHNSFKKQGDGLHPIPTAASGTSSLLRINCALRSHRYELRVFGPVKAAHRLLLQHLTHSLPATEHRNPFLINDFRTPSHATGGGGGWVLFSPRAAQVAFFPGAPNNAVVAQTVVPPWKPRRGELPSSIFELPVLRLNFAFQVSLYEVCHA